MQSIAEDYVRLVLGVGRHDAAYVDAYYGPPAWRDEAERRQRSLTDLESDAADLLARLDALEPTGGDGARRRVLRRQIVAVQARLAMLSGRSFTFDEESAALYDAVAPSYDESHFEEALRDLDHLLPGSGELVERRDRFIDQFVIPPSRLSAVFDAAIAECRRQTSDRITLPPDERFTVEYVTDKPWSGYHWYQGSYRSVIQVNTDLPIYIDRAVDLAAHEGYPGHHLFNLLLEREFVGARGWVEYTVYPLFSPVSLIAEGTANFGIEVAFPGESRARFDRDVLMPLAGVPTGEADRYHSVLSATARLSYAGNEAARRYLDRRFDRADAAAWLTRFGLMSPARAEQRTRFMDAYRSYVINYNLGQDLVRGWIEARGGTADDPDRRWTAYLALLQSPTLPSDLV
jgi:hypothetical protein